MKRITILTGHYGSGKSELSVNLALKYKVDMLVDLDVINPYFRSREVKDLLEESSVSLVASPLNNSLGSDLPYISKEAYIPFRNKSVNAIYDLGGDNHGAKLIKQYIKEINNLNDVDFLFVINVFRPETSSKELIIKKINDIEESSGLKITGLINNSNLLRETTFEDLIYGQDIIREVSKKLNLDMKFTTLLKDIKMDTDLLEGEILPLNLYLRKNWL